MQADDWDGFVAAVRDKAIEEKGRWPELCEQADVTYRWILTFAHNRRREPTASRVLRLAQALDMRARLQWRGATPSPKVLQRSSGAIRKPTGAF